jgi:hypothetical protein
MKTAVKKRGRPPATGDAPAGGEEDDVLGGKKAKKPLPASRNSENEQLILENSRLKKQLEQFMRGPSTADASGETSI